MDLFEVLSKDERIIVFSSEEDSCFYTWNQSATLQCWELARLYGEEGSRAGEWEETGIRTLSMDEPKNYQEARDAAKRWYFGVGNDVVDLEPRFLKRVVIDQPAKVKDTIRDFMITPDRVKAIGKMVKKIREKVLTKKQVKRIRKNYRKSQAPKR